MRNGGGYSCLTLDDLIPQFAVAVLGQSGPALTSTELKADSAPAGAAQSLLTAKRYARTVALLENVHRNPSRKIVSSLNCSETRR